MTHTHFLRRGSSIIGSGGPAFHPNTVAAAAHCSLHICQAYPRRFVKVNGTKGACGVRQVCELELAGAKENSGGKNS